LSSRTSADALVDPYRGAFSGSGQESSSLGHGTQLYSGHAGGRESERNLAAPGVRFADGDLSDIDSLDLILANAE
jgi:hypothetical protein